MICDGLIGAAPDWDGAKRSDGFCATAGLSRPGSCGPDSPDPSDADDMDEVDLGVDPPERSPSSPVCRGGGGGASLSPRKRCTGEGGGSSSVERDGEEGASVGLEGDAGGVFCLADGTAAGLADDWGADARA